MSRRNNVPDASAHRNNPLHDDVIQEFLNFNREFNANMSSMIQTYQSLSSAFQSVIENIYSNRRINSRTNNRSTPIRSQNFVPNVYNSHFSPIGSRNSPNTTWNSIFPSIRQTLPRNIPINNQPRYTQPNPNQSTQLFNSMIDLLYATTPLQTFNQNGFMDPVPVLPSQEQINRATEEVIFGEIETEQQHCPIDLIPFEQNERLIRIRHCNHVFRRNNLVGWFGTSVRCPLCRYDIREYQQSESNGVEETEPVVQETDDNDESQQERNTSSTSSYTFQYGPSGQQNNATIHVDTNVIPLQMNGNNDLIQRVQQELNNMVTGSVMNLFQTAGGANINTTTAPTVLSTQTNTPSTQTTVNQTTINESNVDQQYDLFNRQQ